ncbi:hypothetical protein FA13DRAFT_522217 [Coprinellus micaceus]|uniref:Uncharacterized protein n=1 Tax=Coprinellus micaceus TaxID=71717 RepID=A0A4Y7T8T2_COPMI|nr:hypothetical protein FA13DRAFT_522217 [Coprinellus micaceus]
MCDTPLNASSTSYPFQAFWILLLCTKGCCVDPMVDFLSLSAKLSDLRLLRSSRKGGLTQREPSVPQYRPRAVTGAGHLTQFSAETHTYVLLPCRLSLVLLRMCRGLVLWGTRLPTS